MSIIETGKRIVDDVSSMNTPTELANYEFYQQAKQIEGISIQTDGGSAWNDKTIVVTIPDIFDKAADEVFNLKLRIYDKYPSARLDVYVVEATSGN